MKQNSKLYFLFILSWIVVGCKVTGEYYSGGYYSHTYVNLKQNGIFYYESCSDVGRCDTLTGKWKKNKKIITLNSFKRPDFKPNSIYEEVLPGRKEKLIIVQNMDISGWNSVISINDGQLIDTLRLIDTSFWRKDFPIYQSGIYTSLDSIKNIKILSGNYSDYILKSDIFNVSNPHSNFIIIYAQPFNYFHQMQYFVDIKWMFHKNRIYLWRISENKFSKSSYLKKK